MKRQHLAWLVLCGLIGGTGTFLGACSSSDDSTAQVDSGPDVTLDVGVDLGTPDTADVVKVPDAGADGDGGSPDVGLANCSPANGSCDIVSQNCPSGNECVLMQAGDGGFTTGCNPDQAGEHIQKGTFCCPAAASANPCLPGLECVGEPCFDAGVDAAIGGGGRCAPHCCLSPDGGHDDTPCGSAVPEGYPGHCDLTYVDNSGNALYAVCTYAQVCVPLHVQPCPSGDICLVNDPQGSATCSLIFNPNGDGGATEGQVCAAANACADGLTCLSTGTGGFACKWFCAVPGQMTPFDAGILDASAPGYGGCPDAETCNQATNLFPPWLGFCN